MEPQVKGIDVAEKAAAILIVDDEAGNIRLLEKLLRAEGYGNLLSTRDPREAVPLVHAQGSDLVLLDLNMPHMDGFAVMAALRSTFGAEAPAVLVLTAQSVRDFRLRALEQGARDYLTKPFDRAELLARVRNLIAVQRLHRMTKSENEILEQRVRERTEELRATRLQIVQRLGRAAEYRDNETGFHILRMSHTATLLARAAGMSAAGSELMLHASPMHDIGKIGIPDQILLKPGKLDAQEWEIMKTHTTIGAHILAGDDSELLAMAREIALTHHERWDGSGYPKNLKADAIPLTGRIVAIADVFDALTSERPYKKAWSIEQALDYMQDNRGRHFDATLVEEFIRLFPQVLEIRARYAEPVSPAPAEDM